MPSPLHALKNGNKADKIVFFTDFKYIWYRQ